MIYKPAEDSFLIEKEVRARASGKRVLDVGCGSGILMEGALASGAREVLGVEIDSESVEECRKKGLDVLESDLFENLKTGEKFDLIVFNPPYLPLDSREDLESSLATAGGERGDEVIVRFLGDAGDYLDKKGEILMVVSSLTPLGRIKEVMKKKGFVKDVVASGKFFMEGLEVWEIRKT